MLERARALERPGLRFEQRNITDVDGTWDVLFSHAALQWVPDHESLMPQIFGMVAPGGQIAVQMPSNFDHPTHRFLDDVASEAPFADVAGELPTWSFTRPVLSIERYAEILYACGAGSITVFEKVYPHVLPDADALVEWMSGTALVPFFERLPRELHAEFLERYRARLRERFPTEPVFYSFKRTLFAATKPH
jgi:trans-aconitate 2-methyltransferase